MCLQYTFDLANGITHSFNFYYTPGGDFAIFEEYQTALGVETIINHVGDCFD